MREKLAKNFGIKSLLLVHPSYSAIRIQFILYFERSSFRSFAVFCPSFHVFRARRAHKWKMECIYSHSRHCRFCVERLTTPQLDCIRQLLLLWLSPLLWFVKQRCTISGRFIHTYIYFVCVYANVNNHIKMETSRIKCDRFTNCLLARPFINLQPTINAVFSAASFQLHISYWIALVRFLSAIFIDFFVNVANFRSAALNQMVVIMPNEYNYNEVTKRIV